MRTVLLALLVALGLSHQWRVARPASPTTIGVAVYARRIEGKTFVIERLPTGDCRVVFGGEGQLPIDPARVCVL